MQLIKLTKKKFEVLVVYLDNENFKSQFGLK